MTDSAKGNWQDRRLSPRCAYSATAIVYVGSEQLVCRAVDISSGGMLIIPPNRRERGSFLRINLSLPSFDEVLDIDAIVVREAEVNGRYAWGVAFHEPEPRVVKLLAAFVQWGLARSRHASEAAEPTPPAPVAAEGATEERSRVQPTDERRDTPTSLRAVNGAVEEFAPSDTYGGKKVAPLPNWTEKDDQELDELFSAVLADLDAKT